MVTRSTAFLAGAALLPASNLLFGATPDKTDDRMIQMVRRVIFAEGSSRHWPQGGTANRSRPSAMLLLPFVASCRNVRISALLYPSQHPQNATHNNQRVDERRLLRRIRQRLAKYRSVLRTSAFVAVCHDLAMTDFALIIWLDRSSYRFCIEQFAPDRSRLVMGRWTTEASLPVVFGHQRRIRPCANWWQRTKTYPPRNHS
jgi:hypothetical protein